VKTALLVFALASAAFATTRERVVVSNGSVNLGALLWRPEGSGPFPAILMNHGSGRTPDDLRRLGPYEEKAELVGPIFARHGYVFLYLFRRGVGLSVDQGASAIDLMTAARGREARNAVQIDLLENREMGDALAALHFLRGLPYVDRDDVGVAGESFGGSLTLLMAAREPALRALVLFAGAGYSWDRSPELRAQLLAATRRIRSPVFFIHAANDYSLSGKPLDAELARRHKPHRIEIYPAIGKTPEEGHDIMVRAVPLWEPDVFSFLDRWMR